MDELNMMVNRLPVPTWNWLKMNGARAAAAVPRGEGPCALRLPAGVSQRGAGVPLDIETNAGPDLEALVRESGTGARRFAVTGNAAEPLRMEFCYSAGTSAVNAVEIDVAPGVRASLVMDFSSSGGADGLAAVQAKARLAENSRLDIVQVQRLGGQIKFFNGLGISCAENARASLVQIVLSGQEAYTGCRCSLDGAGSAFAADAGYLARGEERLDMNYIAVHKGARTESEISASGVLRGSASKLFRGTIDFRRGAVKARGSEKEDVLLMDDTAANQTIPLLLCAEEDVEGSHGATVGRLDDALLFYAESRGLSREAVHEMMARARIAAVCSKIADERTRAAVFEYLNGGKSDE